jgi:hypothetical protein
MPTKEQKRKKMTHNKKDILENDLSLNGVLTKALAGLIERDDIAIDKSHKDKTNEEQDALKEQIRLSLIKDVAKIATNVIKDNSGSSKEELITKLADKFLEQPRGEENLETAEGRVAKAIRDKADKGKLITVADILIKTGGPFTDGLKVKIKEILTENDKEIKAALAVEETAKNLAKDGVHNGNHKAEEDAGIYRQNLTIFSKKSPAPTGVTPH